MIRYCQAALRAVKVEDASRSALLVCACREEAATDCARHRDACTTGCVSQVDLHVPRAQSNEAIRPQGCCAAYIRSRQRSQLTSDRPILTILAIRFPFFTDSRGFDAAVRSRTYPSAQCLRLAATIPAILAMIWLVISWLSDQR